MTRPIDEKIVAMKMDNSDFKRKAAETTGIFGKLRQSLDRIPGVNLSKTTRDLGNIGSEVRRIDMDPLARSLQMVSDRFSTLGIIGTTALVNITNRAVNAGIALQKSLTVDQMADGFREYEMKMGSIGTMLANTEWAGTTLDDVKGTLSELNDYADQTIYSFAQMTQNIGRFTAAGVTLGDSTTAIKGLGNLAAVSGSTSDQLNMAMYQMSQALSAGRLTLMDWNSMVNAGMGGKKTQDALVATAKAMGIAVDLSDGFRNSIQDGWLTSEVLLETLKQFGKDESMIAAATRVKTFTQMMSTLREGIGSGWAETWELIFGDFEEATRLWTAISEALKKPFDEMAKSRNDFLRAIIAGNGITHMFSGIQNAVKPLAQLFNIIKLSFQTVFPVSSVSIVNRIAEGFKNLTEGMVLSSKASANIYTIFKGVFSIFSIVWQVVKSLAQAVFGLLPSFKSLGGGILDLLAGVADLFTNLNEMIKSGTLLTNIMNVLGVILGVVGIGINYIGKGLEWVAELIRPIGALVGLSFGGGEIKATNEELVSMKKVLEPIVNFFKGLFESVVNGFNWVKEKLVGFGQMIKDALPDGNELLAGGFIAALIAVTANAVMMGWQLWEVFTGWGGIGEGVQEALEGLSLAFKSFALNLAGAALIKIAIAIAILAASFYMLQDLGYEEIAQGLYFIVGALTGLVGSLAVISKYNLVAQMASTSVIVSLAIAVAILAAAFKKMNNVNPDSIVKGIYAIVGTLTALTGALTIMSKFGGAAIGASALQILAIAGAVHILVSAIQRIAEIDPKELKKGLWTTIEILAQLALFMTVMRGARFPLGATIGILAVGQAIKNIVSAIRTISTVDPKVMKEGLRTIGIILAALGVFAVLSGFGNLLVAGAGMLVISFALQELMKPIQQFGTMQWGTMVQGLFGMSVALIALAAASTLMVGSITGAISIAILATSLNLLTKPIMALSGLKWGELGIALAGLAGVLLLFVVAAVALTPAIPIVLLFGAALGLMGIGMMGAGVGMSLFGTGLLTLSTLSVGAVTTIIATIGTLLTGLISLAPMAAKFLGEIMTKFLDVINEYGPKLYDKMALFIENMLQAIADRMPGIIQAGTNVVINFIEGVASSHRQIVASAINLMITYIESMADAIETEGPRMTDAMMRLWGNVILIMVDAGVSMVNALFGWIPGVKQATSTIGATAEQYIRDNFQSGLAGSDKGEEFASSLTSTQNLANVSGLTIAEAAQAGAESVKMETVGENFGLGFASGISGTIRNVGSAALNMASTAYNAIVDFLDVRSPSRLMDDVGTYTGEGYNNGLASTEDKIDNTANSIMMKIANALGIELPEMALKGGSKTSEELAKGIESGKPKVASSAKSTGKTAAQAASEGFREEMEVLDYKFKMGEIDSEYYIAEIEKIKKAYAKYPELVREANLKIKQIEEDTARNREELRKQEFNNSKAWIDDRKYYNEMSLAEELSAWQRIMDKYEKGTEERKQAEREVYRLKKEIHSKLTAINDDYANKVQETNRRLIEDETRLNEEYESKIADANQRLIDGERQLTSEYENAVADRTRALVGFAGLFDKVNKSNEVSGSELMDNLKSQVDTFKDWSANIQLLASKGVDEGLISELKEMGPKAAGEIAALNTLTDEELSEYTGLWKEKNELARIQAVSELEGLKQDTQSKIDELRSQTTIQLEAYNAEWTTKLNKLRDDTAILLEEYKNEWIEKIREIRYGATDEFVTLETSMKDIGVNSMKGLMEGLSSMEGPLLEQAKAIADSVAETINKALAIGKEKLNLTPKLNKPDTSFTTGTIAATKAIQRQNGSKKTTTQKGETAKASSTVINQNLTFNTKEMTPSEVARKNLQASKELALQW